MIDCSDITTALQPSRRSSHYLYSPIEQAEDKSIEKKKAKTTLFFLDCFSSGVQGNKRKAGKIYQFNSCSRIMPSIVDEEE
jgi:hypothetical protein